MNMHFVFAHKIKRVTSYTYIFNRVTSYTYNRVTSYMHTGRKCERAAIGVSLGLARRGPIPLRGHLPHPPKL